MVEKENQLDNQFERSKTVHRNAASVCLIVGLSTIALSSPVASQSPARYPKAQGGEISLPAGNISFADRVVVFNEGTPPSKSKIARVQAAVLGPPDRKERGESAALTLGCHGEIIVEFTDNALIDVDGPDLHVWEVGPDVEPMDAAISRDGNSWIKIGSISGGTTSIDISKFAVQDTSYRYVKLNDRNCISRQGKWPGADIDAIAAVGSAERFVFDSGVLFAFDEATLSVDAMAVLTIFAKQISKGRVKRLLVEGHTDSDGSESYNAQLSRARAAAVRTFLAGIPEIGHLNIQARGIGELEPVASNSTDEGRQKNRRVEILASR